MSETKAVAFFDPRPAPAGGLHAAATARNREPFLAVLRDVLPTAGLVLEVASGTGEHVAFFAAALPQLRFQPSDPAPAHLTSVRAWTAGLENVEPPLRLDVEEEPWPVERVDAILCINMIHIAPLSACAALLRGAGRALPPGGLLYLYGPYKQGGRHTAASNERFDERLRAEDPRWGVRDVGEVADAAAAVGLALERQVEMPANNLSLVFRR